MTERNETKGQAPLAPMRHFSVGRLAAAALALVILLAIFSVVVVESGQVGVVVRTGAESPARVLAEPGVYGRIPFVERVWVLVKKKGDEPRIVLGPQLEPQVVAAANRVRRLDAHRHGVVEEQILSGMSGMIIVKDGIKTYYPELDGLRLRAGQAAEDLVLRGVAEDGDAHERAAAVEADALAGGGVARRVVVRDHEGPGDVVGAGPVDRGDLVAARVDDLARGPVAGAAGSPALGAVDDHRRALKSWSAVWVAVRRAGGVSSCGSFQTGLSSASAK